MGLLENTILNITTTLLLLGTPSAAMSKAGALAFPTVLRENRTLMKFHATSSALQFHNRRLLRRMSATLCDHLRYKLAFVKCFSKTLVNLTKLYGCVRHAQLPASLCLAKGLQPLARVDVGGFVPILLGPKPVETVCLSSSLPWPTSPHTGILVRFQASVKQQQQCSLC